jgi:sulfite reductase beta subunit-like hemoprotein
MLAIAVTSALIVGFLAGVLTFRRSEQWRMFCACGVTKTCPLGHVESATSAPEQVPR